MNNTDKLFRWIMFFQFAGIIFLCNNIHAQEYETEKRTGTVTYISSQNIYVQFDKSESIIAGDTLYLSRNGKDVPAMVVKYISSRSCAGINISGSEIKLNDKIIAYIIKSASEKNPKTTKQNDSISVISDHQTIVKPRNKESKSIGGKKYWGRFSVQSFTNLTNMDQRNEFQRWRYTFSFGADSILNSPISFSTYSFFAYNTKDWKEIRSDMGRALKIYDFSLSYKFKNKNQFWLGRHLNYKISNIGSIDGLQYQHQLNNFYAGLIIGSHPDFSDYGYNFKMFEYGAYFGRTDSVSNSQMENTIAFFNQTNNFTTDRRYIYYQHTNNLIKGTNFFASTEIDLYKKITGIIKNDPTLTSLFLNLYLNPASFISVGLSYDARRNAVYYETYKSFIDSLFTNEMRQGYRISLTLRPVNKISIMLNGGYRFQKIDIKPSRNFAANVYYTSIPFIDVGCGISYTKIISSYNDGSIAGLRLSKYVNQLDLNLSADIKRTEYKFNSNSFKLVQNSISLDVSLRLPLDLYLGISYEGVFEKQTSNGRFFVDITKRF